MWAVIASIVAAFIASATASKVAIDLVNHGIVLQDVPLDAYLGPAIGLSLLAWLFGSITSFVVGRIGYTVEYDLRSWVYARVQRTPLHELDKVATGQVLTRVQQDLAAVDDLIAVAPALMAIVPILFALAVVVTILSPVMGLLTVGATPINLYILSRMRGRLRGLSWMELNESAEVTNGMVEPVLGIRVVHAFHQRDQHQSRLAAAALRAYQVSMTKARMVARFDLLLKSVPVFINALALLVGARLVSAGDLTVGTFGFAIGLVIGITTLAAGVDQIAIAWQLLRGSQDRLLELLRLPQLPLHTGRTLLPAARDGLHVNKASVVRGGVQVLTNLDLQVAPGELVVVSGPPGSGKSTLAALLAGHLRPESGYMTVEGSALEALTPEEALRAIRVVTEDPVLFAGTVRDNIVLGLRGPLPEADLTAALDASGASEVVQALDGGVDALVGYRGLTLSGGQRQRLAIARALVTRPRILVLDDALSAVQPALEVELLSAIQAFDPQMGVVCLSRRANAVSVADRVVKLQAGKGWPPGRPDDLADGDREQLDAGRLAAAGLSGVSSDPAIRALVARMDVAPESPAVDEARVATLRPCVHELTHPFQKVMALALLFLICTTLTQTIPALLLGRIIDQAAAGALSDVSQTALVTAMLGLVAGVAAFGYTVNTGLFTHGVTYLLRRQVFHRVSSLGIDYYDQELPGQVATRAVTDLGQVNKFLLNSLFQVTVQVTTVVISLSMIGVLAPPVALTVVALGVCLILLTVIGTKLCHLAFGQARFGLGTVITRFEEDVAAVAEIRNLGAGEAQARRYAQASRALMARRRRVVVATAVFSQSLQLVASVAAIIVLRQAGGLVVDGALTVGLALTLQTLTTMAITPISSILTQYNNSINTAVSWRRLRELYEAPLLPRVQQGAPPCPPIVGPVTFEDVVFRYPHTQQTVLHQLSFSIPAATITALVGYTGAGKSSIAKLLQRAYDPDSGAITVDGTDIRTFELASYRHRIGVVPQDAYLFRGTIASNIRYGRPGASREEVVAAADAVGALDQLGCLAGGVDAYVAGGGSNLTGAQRQLVALARAWLTKPDLLVLDEATSALDPVTERAVLQALKALKCTTLAVTHRESVVAAAQHVLVIANGKIVDTGTRRRVTTTSAAYRQLWPAPADGPAFEVVAL